MAKLAAGDLILGGACAGMLPGALHFAYMRLPHQPLTSSQRFHEWIHTSRRMCGRPVLGIASQFAFIFCWLCIPFCHDSDDSCDNCLIAKEVI
jgi:hypothetical protein